MSKFGNKTIEYYEYLLSQGLPSSVILELMIKQNRRRDERIRKIKTIFNINI